MSQDVAKKEIGLSASGFETFSFLYKYIKAEGKYRRLSGGVFNLRAGNSNSSIDNLTLGLRIGFEKRKSIDETLEFIHGWNPSFELGISNDRLFAIPGLGYILGFQHHLSDKFLIGIEAIPTMTTILVEGTSGNFNVGFSSTRIALTLLRKF